MQRIFHSNSLFTEDIDPDLLYGIDVLLKAIYNNSNFDGYSHGNGIFWFPKVPTFGG